MSKFTSDEALYQQAVRILHGLGYDLSSVYKQHSERVDKHEQALPTELDLKYALTTPDSWLPHFEREIVSDRTLTIFAHNEKGKPLTVANDFLRHKQQPLFGTSTIRVDAQFRLTRGQRKVLTDIAGLTPTQVVTITDLELFEGTKAVRRLTIASNVHTPEHLRRRHLLSKWTITNFGDFMQRAHDKELELADVKVDDDEETKPSKSSKPSKPLADVLKDYIL